MLRFANCDYAIKLSLILSVFCPLLPKQYKMSFFKKTTSAGGEKRL